MQTHSTRRKSTVDESKLLIAADKYLKEKRIIPSMHPKPRRLHGARPPARSLSALPSRGQKQDSNRYYRSLMGPLRAIRRCCLLLGWTLLAIPIQAVLIRLPGPGKARFARVYWSLVLRILGVKVRVIGTPAKLAIRRERPVIFVANHSSWLDIPVLGGTLFACFVSKEDIAHWPMIRTIARLGRTVFVSRQRTSIEREREEMRMRLAEGDNLVLFPEGTTSDGSRVLPFRSTFLSVVEGLSGTQSALPPLVQPVSVAYDRLWWLPTQRCHRALFAYYGNHTIGSHFWRLVQNTGMRASVLLHEPIDPTFFPDRKALAQELQARVAAGAAMLRQNRDAVPLSPPAPLGFYRTTSAET